MMKVDSQSLLHAILRLHAGGRLIVGIDGLSRSGKTTLVRRLQRKLVQNGKKVCVFHLDDHIVERNKRYDTGCEPWYEYYALQWDVSNLKEQLFSKVREANRLTLPFYDEERDTCFQKTVEMERECIVLIEGVFLQRSEWRSFFDFVAYLDCPRDVRFRRESEAVQRNIEKLVTRYWKAEDYYIKTVEPASKADIVIGP
jgi:uridine kinase